MRIHIAGGAASGKTTLASRLSAELNLRVLNLDTVGFYPEMPQAELAARRQALLDEARSPPGSITEGAFVGWAEQFFDLADVIVFLDVTSSTALRRVVYRHFRASLRGTNAYKGLRRLTRFLIATRHWYRSTKTYDEAYGLRPSTTGVTHLADTRRFLESYSEKLVVCRSDEDVVALIRSLRP